MKLYLVRHGEAVPKAVDPDRPLSDKGRSQVSRVSLFLKPQRIEVSEIWHSGKLRAVQTAEIAAGAVYAKGGLVHRDGLAPNDPVKPIAKQLCKAGDDLVIVGHLPFLDLLACALLTGDKGREFVAFDEASVARLERDDDGRWRLAWLVGPELVA